MAFYKTGDAKPILSIFDEHGKLKTCEHCGKPLKDLVINDEVKSYCPDCFEEMEDEKTN